MYVEPYLKARNGLAARRLDITLREARAMAKRPATVEKCGGEFRAALRVYCTEYGECAAMDVDYYCARCGTPARQSEVPTTIDDVNAALTAYVARMRQPKGSE